PTPTGSTLNWVQIIDPIAGIGVGAGAGGTFLRTDDGGNTWTVYKDIGGLSSTGFYRTIYDGHFFDANTGLLCGSSGTLIRTTDGGATWDSVGVGSTSTMYDLFFLNTTTGFVVGTTTIDVWKTTDGGLTWTATGGALPGTGYGIWAIDEDTLLVASTSGNVRRSTDGGATWSSVLIGIVETLRHVEMNSATNGWVTGDDGAASYTTDAGATWTLANTGLGTTSDYNDVDILSTTTHTLNEGFEDVTFPPTGWHTKNILGSIVWFRDNTVSNSGTASARVSWDAAGGEDWLVTPMVSIVTGDSLKFWARKIFSSVFEPDTIEVRISITDTSVASFTDVIFKSSTNVAFTTTFEQFGFDLSAYNGMDIYIAFRHYDVDGNGMYLDDITVGEPTLAETVWATGDSFDMYFTTDMGTSWNPFSHLDPSQAWTGEFFSTEIVMGTDAITVGTRGMINEWTIPGDAGTSLNSWIKSGTLYDIWAQSEGGRVVAVGAPGSSGNTFDQAMYSADGGDTWAIAISDSTPHDFNDLSMVDSALGYACLEDNFVYKTTDGGETWTDIGQVAVSTNDLEEIFFVDANTGYTFGAADEGYKTTDGGATWSVLTTGVTATLRGSYFTDANTGWVVGSSGTVLYTTDGGTTFATQDPGSTTTLYSIWMVNANVGYLCGSSSTVRKTTDGGTSWDTLTLPFSTTIYDVEFRFEDNGMFVGSSGRTFTTEDGGTTWLFENNSSSTLYGVAIETASADTSATYTCGSLGFIMRNSLVVVPVELAGFTASVSGSDVTLNWQTATELNNMGFEIERREVDADWVELGYIEGRGTTTETSEYVFVDKNVIAGTYNYRIKQIDFDGSFEYYNLADAVEVGVPDQFKLSQNYPNPFNPTTKINYSVPVDGFVTISIYNILGEEVTTLINANVKAGNYEVTFDATNFASGMY
ncbi:YCF48-related protein, partial [Bacteroidota bacterium]